MELVDVYRDGRPIGHVSMSDLVLEQAITPRSRSRELRPRLACAHEQLARGFAYRQARDEHWPVSYCDACLTLIAGRDPFARTRKLPRWKYHEQNVVLAKWTREWPKRGRPLRSRPPESVPWPDAA